jgi:hypothetical protein
MQYVYSTNNGDYYVSFEEKLARFTHKTSRLGFTCRIRFDQDRSQFSVVPKESGEHRVFGPEFLSLCLPMYSQWIDSTQKREEGRQLARSLEHDINDLAARNFNSFTGAKGG